MANDTSTAHMTPDELVDYFAARVSESREEAIEMHLGACDACAEEARQLRAFSAVWDDWTMQAPDEAWEQVALATALQQVQPQVDNSDLAGATGALADALAGKSRRRGASGCGSSGPGRARGDRGA